MAAAPLIIRKRTPAASSVAVPALSRIPISKVWEALFCERIEHAKKVTPGQVRVLCPFHRDTNPSMDVHLEKDQWLCRACGEGGGIVRLVARELGVDEDSARTWIARHC